MSSPRPNTRRKVKARLLLAAAAGSAVLVLTNCEGANSGNLIAPPTCGPDGGPPQCINRTPTDDGGTTDGGPG